jgi:hypothetical protein
LTASPPSPLLLQAWCSFLREDLGKTLVCAFEITYLVALGDSCDCGFLITLGDCRHQDSL